MLPKIVVAIGGTIMRRMAVSLKRVLSVRKQRDASGTLIFLLLIQAVEVSK